MTFEVGIYIGPLDLNRTYGVCVRLGFWFVTVFWKHKWGLRYGRIAHG